MMPVPPLNLTEPVTKHMRTDVTKIFKDATTSSALASIREQPIGSQVVYFYIVDETDKLVGVVPTRRLLRANLMTPISDIMVAPVISIPSQATVLDACEFFTLHKLLAFPVVDENKKLIGLVDINLYTDEIQDLELRQEGQDLFELVGVHLTEAEQKKSLVAVKKRLPWLMCNVVGGMLAALLADAFSDVSTLILVTPFIALVTGLAEGVAIQSVSLALQTMHGVRPTWNILLRRVGRELIVALLMGLACGVIVGGLSFAWKGHLMSGVCLCIGITGGIVGSAAIGLSLPYLLRMARRDPQLASGPIALAAADMVTLLCYFNLGRWLLL